jgi:hypothetical protein
MQALHEFRRDEMLLLNFTVTPKALWPSRF